MPPEGTYLWQVPAERLPADFALAYEQMKLPFKQGGHQLRRWADFADAAFIGQWALTVQTTHDPTTGRGMFPIFERILADAHALQHHGDASANPCQLAHDLCDAWTRLLHRAQTNAVGADAANQNSCITAEQD